MCAVDMRWGTRCVENDFHDFSRMNPAISGMGPGVGQ